MNVCKYFLINCEKSDFYIKQIMNYYKNLENIIITYKGYNIKLYYITKLYIKSFKI